MVMETETTGDVASVEGEVVADLTKAEARHLRHLEGRITSGLRVFREVGMALLDIRDNRLYRQRYSTFEAYCAERWNMARDRAYQLIGSAEVLQVLGDDGPENEAQARELVPLMHDNPEAVKVVWAKVKEREQTTGKPATAAVIREVARAVTQPDAPIEATPAERIIATTVRLGRDYARWKATKPSRRDQNIVKAAFAQLHEVTG